jgi:deoxyribodipyrimidine photo-lyase
LSVPEIRIRALNGAAVRPEGAWVVYWMIAARRTRRNFALERAVEHATALGRPLLVFEGLRSGYPFACDRFHRFVIQGMVDNRRALEGSPALYVPYLEPEHGAGKGLLAALAERACVVVTDDYPTFMLPRMLAAAARQLPVRLEVVDGNGLLPMRAAEKAFARAYDFRRFLQRTLPEHLPHVPAEDPIAAADLPPPPPLPGEIADRWPVADLEARLAPGGLVDLPIDHAVEPTDDRGGAEEGARRLRAFLDRKLERYVDDRNRPDPEIDVTSRLSPYLHFGHVAAHDVFLDLMLREDWSLEHLGPKATGGRSGWWGVSATAEAFLDQLVTWRELGFNACVHMPEVDAYDSLPEWARRTLAEHEDDPREHLYELAAFRDAATHDPLWNAAQRQLRLEGRIHNYLRMLWGKKILEWSRTPQEALATMLDLNDRYALDGRDPNSLSGIFWCLGRYDRAWGPERPIFGKIRYMSSRNTARKVDVRGYLATYPEH